MMGASKASSTASRPVSPSQQAAAVKAGNGLNLGTCPSKKGAFAPFYISFLYFAAVL